MLGSCTPSSIRLIDQEVGAQLDLMSDPHPYRLLSKGPEKPYHLTILAGSEEYVEEQTEALTVRPRRVVLDPNAPNPFNATTRIRFGVPQASDVTLEIFNQRGERVATLLERQPKHAGFHTAIWHGTDYNGQFVASGIYHYRLRVGGEVHSRPMVLVK